MKQNPGPTLSSVVLIPAHNEQEIITEIIRDVRSIVDWEVVVIDDASTDATVPVARAAGATVLPLPLRLGAWGAIQTGIRYALGAGYRSVITMDADGQHRATYITSLIEPINAGRADVVIGACLDRASRARRIAWSYFRLLTGLRLEDITSGFRAYNHPTMQVLATAEASLLDYQDVGVLLILRRKKLKTIEIPVAMEKRRNGRSRVFSSWLVVASYMIQTSLLCIARIGADRRYSEPVRQGGTGQ